MCCGCFFCTAGQEQPAFIAALHEKDVENCGEEDTLTIWTRCQKNLEKQGNSHAMKILGKGQNNVGK